MMILIVNIIGQLLADAGLADEFVNFVVIPLAHLFCLVTGIG